MGWTGNCKICITVVKWSGTIKVVGNMDHTKQTWIYMQTPLSPLAECGLVGEGTSGKVLNWTVHSLNHAYSTTTINYSNFLFSSTGRDQSSLCDTLLSVCPSVRPSVCPSVRLSVRKQFLLSHLLWGYLSQRLLYSPSLLALWCSCAPAIEIMILSPGAQKGGVAIFPI